MTFIFQLYQSGPFRFPSAFWGNLTIFLRHPYLIHCYHMPPATQNHPTKSVQWSKGMRNIDIAFTFRSLNYPTAYWRSFASMYSPTDSIATATSSRRRNTRLPMFLKKILVLPGSFSKSYSSSGIYRLRTPYISSYLHHNNISHRR
jgi:hypothetical protein